LSKLLDTSILVGFIRRDAVVLNWLQRNAAQALSIPAVTVFELSRGVQRESDRKDVQVAVGMVSVISMDGSIADRAGEVFRRYAPSHGIDLGDAIVAATALVIKLPLVTMNAKHFPMVKRLERPY